MRRTDYVFVLAGLLSLLALPLWAEAPADQQKEEEPPEVTVVVTAERAARPVSESIASATVVTAKEIRESGAKTVADVLELVPGVTMRERGQQGSVATAYVRGANPNQVLVLLDGQRISSPAFISGADLSKFPVNDIARVEVIRGPVSSLYGSEAIGGVINIITRKPTANGGESSFSAGSNGREERTFTYRGVKDDFAWQFGGSFPQYEGDRPNSAFGADDYTLRASFPAVKGWEIALRGEDYRDSLGLPGPDYAHTGAADLDDHQWWDRENVDLTAKRDFGPGQLEWRAYEIRQRLHNIATNEWGNYDSLFGGTCRASELTYRGAHGNHEWVVGGEYRNEDYRDEENSALAQQSSLSNRAVFAQDRWEVAPGTGLVVGARLDDHSAAGSKTTPRIGVTRLIGPGAHLRASYAEGFRAPSFIELYYPAGPYGPGYSGNPALKPETSRQFEVGVNAQAGNDTVDVALFSNDVKNLIDATFSTPYENIAQACERGIEVTWDHRITRAAKFALSYSYLDATKRPTGERLLGRPHNKIGLTVAGKLRSWDLGLTGWWTDTRLDYGNVEVPGAAMFDMTFARRMDRGIAPYVTITNITNASYQLVDGYPAEGRSLELGVRSAW